MKKLPVALFLSHGGGPLPLLGDPAHQQMVECLKKIAADIEKPSAIVVISAHWEAVVPTISASAQPGLLYDYFGFPLESYQIQYPAPGDPGLAKQIFDRLVNEGFSPKLDAQRGFDHGLFVPLKLLFPDADIPCVQLSLVNTLSPQEHLRIGNALRSLGDGKVLVIGSGFSFHNMQAFFAHPTEQTRLANEAFENWLVDTCSNSNLSEEGRAQRFLQWHQAPAARHCHPREEHLLPLMVCYGLANSASSQYFEVEIMGKKSSMYLWR